MRRLLIYGVVAIASGARAFACSQVADKIKVDGIDYGLFTNPLELLYETQKRPEFADSLGGRSTANWRGYVASWEIQDDRLFLVAIDTYLEKKKISLSELFARRMRNERVFAEWFSGQLRVPEGEQLQVVRIGYASTYQRDIFLEVQKGRVISRAIVDNRKLPLPNEWERGDEELRKLQEWREKTKAKP
jgi:hypothetical protein